MIDVICPICIGKKNILKDEILHVYQCGLCGHQFTILPKDHQETYGAEYFDEGHKNWFSHPNTRLFKRIIGDINKYFGEKFVNLNLLDVGCGNGDFLKFLRKSRPNTNLYGIDVVKNSDPGISFIQGDFYTYLFDIKFDALTNLMVIEHVDDPKLFVKKAYDILKQEGLAVFVTINSDSVIYRLARLFKKLGFRGPYERLYQHHHLQHYTNKSLADLLERGGFEIMRQQNHNFPIAAIDLPQSGALIKLVYKAGVAVVFALTSVFGGGINQTIICRKQATHGR